MFEIVDGEGRSFPVDTDPPDPPSSIDYDRQITIEDGQLISDEEEDEPLVEAVNTISSHLQDNLGFLFNSQVTSLHLQFGVINENGLIHLLDGSGATALNGFTLNLFSEIPGGEQALTEFIISQISCEWNGGRQCVTNSPKCTPAGYQCPRIFVVLNRAHKRFPTVNEARLYRLLKARFQAIDPEFSHKLASVCIGCLHVYTAEQRIYQAQKATNRLPATMGAPLFEALVPSEVAAKGKTDVGLTPKGIAAYSYLINLRNSPYRTSPVPNLAPAIRTSITAIKAVPKTEKWAERLYHSAVSPSIKCAVDADGDPFRTVEFSGPKPWMRPTTVSYSHKLAPRMYTKPPFTYEFLDRVRERANRNIERARRLKK
jgi:hypothetical protein